VRLGQDPELEQLRERVRAFVATHEHGTRSRTGVRAPEPDELPALREWAAALHAEGLLGVYWPVEWGGQPDPHPLHEAVVRDELAVAGAPLPVGAGSLAASALIEYGTPEQKRRYLPAIRSAEHIWCQLFSEPGAGSDLASLRTRAVRDGDVFVIDGQKVWTTNGQHADVGYLLARTDPDVPKHRGITAFALDMRAPGVTVRPLREITGTSDFNEVFFDGVRIPAGNVIGEVDDGWRVASASLVHERSGVSGGVVLGRALGQMLRIARGTQRVGAPAIENHAVRQDLGRFVAETQVSTLLTAYVESRALHGSGDAADAPISKIFFSEVNLAMAEYGMALQGADGVRVEGDPDAVAGGWWQDAFLYARAYTIAGGANEVLRNLIAERALGLPREPRPS
jgi:alkylation response protein AidB-like acyl-CoA dehydrogenase